MIGKEKLIPLRILCLITTPKLAKKAIHMFQKGNILAQYEWNALGTAPSELIDILGLGSPEKRVILSVLPKPFAKEMLEELKKARVIGTRNSGIAFTLQMSGANHLILQIVECMCGEKMQPMDRKDEREMEEIKYVLITAIVNQGYSENVMEVARNAGAGGGTVVPTRRIGNKAATKFWGMSIQEEKEMIFIIVEKKKKLEIMRAIGEQCGIHSEAKGLVVSVPIDTVIGVGEK